MLPRGEFHPFALDSFGMGALFLAAHRKGAKHCLVGIGGSATNDGGFGLARAMGWGFFDRAGNVIERWPDLQRLEKICPPPSKQSQSGIGARTGAPYPHHQNRPHSLGYSIEVAVDVPDALASLAERIHTLLFTDQLEFVRAARQLETGSATHVVFIRGGETGDSEYLRAGANEVMPEEARGERFWAHMTLARRLIGFAETLQTAISGNRILSTIDELTRCGNRRFFEQQFPREVARAIRLRRPLAVLMCDIDHFKSVNDRHGHQVGDEVLSQFGDRLTRGLRQGQDWAARIGGEEFAVVLPETGRAQAIAIAERLRRLVSARHFSTNLGSIAVTASFGVCGVEDALPGREDLTAQMVIAADSALYTSKRQGRNRVTEGSAEPQAR